MSAAELPVVIVDTNILFSALLAPRSAIRDTLLSGEYTFHVCESVLVELFRHQRRILAASRLSEDEVVRWYSLLLKRLVLSREEMIPEEHWDAARELCRGIDETDAPHVALTLALNGRFWTGDKHLKEGLLGKGFGRFFVPSASPP